MAHHLVRFDDQQDIDGTERTPTSLSVELPSPSQSNLPERSRPPPSPTRLRRFVESSLNTLEAFVWHSDGKKAQRKRAEREARQQQRARRPSPVPAASLTRAARGRPALIPPHHPRSDVPVAAPSTTAPNPHADDSDSARRRCLAQALCAVPILVLWVFVALADACCAARWRRRKREAAEERADVELDGVFDADVEITIPI